MRRSLARRIALGRPKRSEIEQLLEEIDGRPRPSKMKAKPIGSRRFERLAASGCEVSPSLTTVDLRYNRFEPPPKPTTQAVMFCLMDTSASMTETLKDLAKRFYMLLHLFLKRHYRAVEIVFIRHTYTAAEVDEDTFFHGRETGGTIVSSALQEMLECIQQRYPVDDWNIYAAQASDGHNFDHDMPETLTLLQKRDPAHLPVLRLHRSRRRGIA